MPHTGKAKSKLPPRSRTGCWTCRVRKVKCDEKRPVCDQCARLQHECDYSPRLAFRDDTPRVVDRLQEVRRSGSGVWDPQSSSPERDAARNPEDSLPPFQSLESDEDRERKAESHEPGTYMVVMNQESFSSLPEYSEHETEAESEASGDSLTRMVKRSKIGGRPRSVPSEEDPHVLLVKKFDESGRRSSKSSGSLSPSQSLLAQSVYPRPILPSTASSSRRESSSSTAAGDEVILENYRKTISPYISYFYESRVQSSPGKSPVKVDAYEELAATFPPLHHAILALSSLSLAWRTGARNIDALQHYQRALPSLKSTLKSSDDLASDGILFTHFFLLLYEISGVEQGGANLWQDHLGHLLNTVLIRRRVLPRPENTMLIWFVSTIDTFGSLSQNGGGNFAEAMIQRNMLGVAYEDALLAGSSTPRGVPPEEHPLLADSLRFNQQVLILASQLGRRAQAFRRRASRQAEFPSPDAGREIEEILNTQRQVAELQKALRRIWDNGLPKELTTNWLQRSKELNERTKGFFLNACAIHRLCLIYSHTTMWADQQEQFVKAGETEIVQCVTDIFALASFLIRGGRIDIRFIILPIFMAGFASEEKEDKMLAIRLIKQFEKQSFGRNTSMVRELLGVVYERQKEALLQTGSSYSVDWISVMEELGLGALNFAL